MATEEPKPTEEVNPKFKEIQDKLDNESVNNYSSQFDKMVHSPEWQLNGDTFHYQVQSHKKIKQRKDLEKEEIDENKDWDKYVDNYFQRAQLLIREGEMTKEKFDELDFYDVENLVAAWSVRSRRGFPKDEQSVSNVV